MTDDTARPLNNPHAPGPVHLGLGMGRTYCGALLDSVRWAGGLAPVNCPHCIKAAREPPAEAAGEVRHDR